MQFSDLTEQIIGCAYRVYNTMEFGFLEAVYENCLMIELERAGLEAEQQVPVDVEYDGQPVGEFVADIVVEDAVILELKSVRRLMAAHEAQLVNYLTATGKTVGLLLNFAEGGVEVRRKVQTLKDGFRQD